MISELIVKCCEVSHHLLMLVAVCQKEHSHSFEIPLFKAKSNSI